MRIQNDFLMLMVLTGVFALGAAGTMAQTVVYDAVPGTLDPNYPSQPFQAQQTAEFGDYVHLAGTNRVVKKVTVTMSNWALASTPANVTYCTANPGTCTAAGFNHPFTINIYNIGPPLVGGVRSHGSLLGTVTQTKTVPWRPADDLVNCPADSAWFSGGSCYHGYAFNLTFDLSGLAVTVPNDIVIGIAYNTQTYGAAPIGVDGPYNSLNVALTG